tara:strand:+ start:1767 stop:3221 length:1455 start_codon:yes stop_codon:yes gene_type:complete
MSNTKIEEAKRLVSGLVKHQRESDNRMNNFEQQVKDLKKAQQLMVEGQEKKSEPVLSGGDYALKQYLSDDDGVRLKTKSVRKQINGRGLVNVEEPGLLDADHYANEWHKDLCKMTQERSLVRGIMETPHTPKADMKLYNHLMKAPSFFKPAIEKIFSDSAGSGGDWIPDEFASELYQSFEIPRGLRSLFADVQMDRETLLVPKLVRGGRPYIKGAATDDLASYTASTIETAQSTIRAKGLAVLMNIDDAAGEDSAFAIIPAMSRQVAQDLEDAYEDCIINGDTAASHQDAIENWNIRERWGTTPSLGSASDHRRTFLGLRAAALDAAKSTGFNTTFNFSNFLAVSSAMGEQAMGNRIIIASPEAVLANFLGLTEVATVDKYGPQATVLSGEIASLAGMPIILSRFMGADLNTAGLFDNATKTKTGYLIVNRESYYNYVRRRITIETQKDIKSGVIQIVSTMRGTFGSPDAAATKNVAYHYNLAI